MPADLPALTKLTDDVVAAMHTAEQRERRRHGSRTRHRFGVLAVLVALLVPSGLALHASSADGRTAPPPDHGKAYAFATAAGACTAGAVLAAAAAVRAAPASCDRVVLRPAAPR
jgi:hypothetical protein